MTNLKSIAITILCVTAYLTTHAHEALRRGHEVPGGEIMFLIAIPLVVYYTREGKRGK